MSAARLFVLTLVAFAGLAPQAAAPVGPPRPALAGTVALGARAADPEGGDAWVVRSWRRGLTSSERAWSPRPRLRCLQVGRLRAAGLYRTVAPGIDRPMRIGDRAACINMRAPEHVPLVERLTDDAAHPTRVVRTIVAGLAPRGVTEVVVTARGEPRTAPVDPATGTYLAVFDGSVRRSDLAVRGGRLAVDFGGGGPGDNAVIPSTIRRGPGVADPLGGAPFGTLRFETDGADGGPCLEPGRVIAGEVGAYESSWGSFLEAPTRIFGPDFEDDWAPLGWPLAVSAHCRAPDPGDVEHRVQRYDDRIALVSGLAGRDVASVAVAGPDGTVHPATLEDGAFVAALPSTGAVNESARLVVTLRSGRRAVTVLHLGPHDVKADWHRYQVRERGRVLRVFWGGGTQPFSGADVRATGRSVTVTIFERYGPSFSPEGISIFYNLPLIFKCADVVLPRPLSGREVRAARGAGGTRRARAGQPRFHARGGCRRVRSGERLGVDWRRDSA